MKLVNVAKVGCCYLRHVNPDIFNTSTIWKVIGNNGSQVAVEPVMKLNTFDVRSSPTLVLIGTTDVVGGDGTLDNPFLIE